LPSSLKQLSCAATNLSYLPELPDTLQVLRISDNQNLICLPELKTIFSQFAYINTGIQCLPNYPILGTNTQVIPPLSTYPLCDLFNPNGCDVYWNISGNVYKDNNSNCIKDAGEQNLSNLKLQLFQNGNLIQQTYLG